MNYWWKLKRLQLFSNKLKFHSESFIFISMKGTNKNLIFILLVFAVSVVLMSCRKGVGCPADQYNDWKKIEAMRKQQLKSPSNPNKGKNSKKPNVYGNGIVPQ
jgi:hypothetical protein